MTDEQKLAACPFCGGEAETVPQKFTTRILWGVKRNGCGDVWLDCREDTEVEAGAAWNTRAPITPPADPPIFCAGTVFNKTLRLTAGCVVIVLHKKQGKREATEPGGRPRNRT